MQKGENKWIERFLGQGRYSIVIVNLFKREDPELTLLSKYCYSGYENSI